MKTLILAASLLLCSACKIVESYYLPGDLYKSYIWGYFDTSEIAVADCHYFSIDEARKRINSFDSDLYVKDKTSFRISDGIAIRMNLGKNFVYKGGGEASRKRYEALRDELKDTTFNRRLSKDASLPTALTGMIDKIRITVDEHFSAAYPSGADVSALFTICYEHPYAVILNNYQAPPGTYEMLAGNDAPPAGFVDNLAQVDLSGKKALGPEFYFLLTVAPDKSGSYTFTVEVLMADGNTLTATTDPIPIEV